MAEKGALEASLSETSDALNALQTQHQELTERHESFDERFKALSAEHEAGEAKIEALNGELEALNQAKSALDAELESLNEELARLTEEQASEAQVRDELKRQHFEELSEREHAHQSLQEDLSLEKERVQRLSDELTRLRERAARELQSERQGRERLALQATELNAQMGQLSLLGQKVSQTLEIAQLFLEHMHEVEVADPSDLVKSEPANAEPTIADEVAVEAAERAREEALEAERAQRAPEVAPALEFDDDDFDLSLSIVASDPPQEEEPASPSIPPHDHFEDDEERATEELAIAHFDDQPADLDEDPLALSAEDALIEERSYVEIDFDDDSEVEDEDFSDDGVILSGPPSEVSAEVSQTPQPEAAVEADEGDEG